MNRRSFFNRLGAGLLTAVAAIYAPGLLEEVGTLKETGPWRTWTVEYVRTYPTNTLRYWLTVNESARAG